MAKLGYALHKGDVFKKNETSMYTLEHACSMKKFPVSPGKQRSIEGDYHHKFQQARIYTNRPRVRIYTTVTNQLRLN